MPCRYLCAGTGSYSNRQLYINTADDDHESEDKTVSRHEFLLCQENRQGIGAKAHALQETTMAMVFNRVVIRNIAGILILALQTAIASAAESQTYEAELPAQIFTAQDLCAYAPCADVIPSAYSFSQRMGKPPYVEAYEKKRNGKKLIGYVFLTTDVVDVLGYSAKPFVTLVGMDTNGIITGAKVLRHSESIHHFGIREEELTKFIRQYTGKFVGARIEIGRSHISQEVIELDAISGATVTSVLQNQVILQSGIEIARQVGIIKRINRPRATYTNINESLSWDEMVTEGSIQRLRAPLKEMGVDANGDYIDIYFGYLNAPAIGRSVLGDRNYKSLISRLQPGEHAIFIVASGAESFKGSGFVRGGSYERIKVVQDMDTFIFRDLDYLNLYGIKAKNTPDYRESGIFIIRSDSFNSAYPWKLVFLSSKVDLQTGKRTFISLDKEYWLPARYLVGGHPLIEHTDRVMPRAME